MAWPAQPSASDAAMEGVSSPAAAVGSIPCARGCWQSQACRGAGVRLAAGRTGAHQSCHGDLSPPAGHHAAKRTGEMTMGAGARCHLMGSQEADASPGHRFWPHFIKPHVSKSTSRCTPALQSRVHGGAGCCQWQVGLGAASLVSWRGPRCGAGGGRREAGGRRRGSPG